MLKDNIHDLNISIWLPLKSSHEVMSLVVFIITIMNYFKYYDFSHESQK